MKTIKELFNKIKWDPKERPEEYSFCFIDLGRLVELPYTSIKRIEGNFVVIEREGKEAEIPLHRVKEVHKRGAVVWKR
ncbi:MAG: DUF504 domain-containing protein [Candidatus Woesearchaeota archaeon]